MNPMKKILIIEDDQIVANIYRNKLSVEGFNVEVALDGEAGLSALKHFKPDAVLLDLMLPKITGIDLMKQVRAEADFAQTPIIVFSNTYLTNMVQEAWKAGATKCLSKASCTPKHVIEALRTTLGIAGNGATAITPATATATNPGGARLTGRHLHARRRARSSASRRNRRGISSTAPQGVHRRFASHAGRIAFGPASAHQG
jgi:DNA-binding response OmpR family regulator